MRSLLFYRCLVIYLCANLAFPPFLWGQAQPAPVTSGKRDRTKKISRSELRTQLHSSAYLVSKAAQGLARKTVQMRSALTLGINKPYEKCDDPLKNPASDPDTIREVREALIESQEMVSDFLAQQPELGKTSYDYVDLPGFNTRLARLEIEPIQLNGKTCTPLATSPGLPDLNQPENLKEVLRRIEEGSKIVQIPFFVLLGFKQKEPLTNMEALRWFGWINAQLEEWNILIQAAQERGVMGIEAIPDFRIPKEPGQRLKWMSADTRGMSMELGRQKILSGRALQDDLPHFDPCTDDPDFFCLRPLQHTKLLDPLEKIALQIEAPQKATYGTFFNAKWQLDARYLMEQRQFAYLHFAPSDQSNLPQACVNRGGENGDMKELVQAYNRDAKRQQNRWRIIRLMQAVGDLTQDFSDGTRNIPLPPITSRLLQEGNDLAAKWVTEALAGLPGYAGRLRAQMQSIPFFSSLHDRVGNPKGQAEETEDFVSILSEKLRLGVVIDEQELNDIDESNPNYYELFKKKVLDHLDYVALFAMADGLALHVLDSAEDILDPTAKAFLMDWWKKKYRMQWESILQLKNHQKELHEEMAVPLHEAIFSHAILKKENFKAIQFADELLTQYVRQMSGPAKRAVEAHFTFEYMNNLENLKAGPNNLLPGRVNLGRISFPLNPKNYHYKASGTFLDDSPIPMQLDDGEGHGYGYTMSRLDPRFMEDHLYFQKAFLPMALRSTDQVTERLKNSERPFQAYTDTAVDNQFKDILNVKMLANLLLEKKFAEVLQADANEDRGRLLETRAESLADVKKWLSKPGSETEKAYNEEILLYAGNLFRFYLEPLLKKINAGKDVEMWKQEFNKTLANLAKDEIFIHTPEPEKILIAYQAYEKRSAEEKKKGDDAKKLEDEKLPQFQAIQKEIAQVTEQDVMEGWNQLLSKPAEAKIWLEKATQPLTDNKDEAIKKLFLWRVQRGSENYLSNYIEVLSHRFKAADKEKKASVDIEAAEKTNLQSELFKVWLGIDIPEEIRTAEDKSRADLVAAKISELTAEVRAQWLKTPNRPLEQYFLTDLPLAIQEKTMPANGSFSMFQVWQTQISESIKRVLEKVNPVSPPKPPIFFSWLARKANEEEEKKKKLLVLAHGFVRELLFGQYYRLTGSIHVGPRWMEALFMRELAPLMLPKFVKFQSELLDRIEVVLNPQANSVTVLKNTNEAVVRLTKDKWRLEKDKKLVKEVQERIDDLNENAKLYQVRLRNYLEAKHLIETYIPRVEAVVEAHFIDENTSESDDEVWDAYFRDQFEYAMTDAVGEKLAIPPANVFQDLKTLTEGSKNRLPISLPQAKVYLTSLKKYCEVAQTAPIQQAFKSSYQLTVAADYFGIPRSSGLRYGLSHVVNILSDKPRRARLKVLWDMRNPKGTEAQFEAWCDAAPADAVQKDPRLQDHYLWRNLPTSEDFCQVIQRSSDALLNNAVFKKDPIESKDSLSPEATDDLWSLVQRASTVFLNPHSRFADWITEAGAVGLESTPTVEISASIPKPEEFAKRSKKREEKKTDKDKSEPKKENTNVVKKFETDKPTETVVNDTLFAFLQLPHFSSGRLIKMLGLDEELPEDLKQLGTPAPPPPTSPYIFPPDKEGKQAWSSALSLSEREYLFDAIRTHFLTSLNRSGMAMEDLGLFTAADAPKLDRKQFEKQARLVFRLWDALKNSEFKMVYHETPQIQPLAFETLTTYIYKLFLVYTPFRYSFGHVIFKEQLPKDRSLDVDLGIFQRSRAPLKYRIIEEIEAKYRAYQGRVSGPPRVVEYLPEEFERLPSTFLKDTPQEVAVRFFLSHFVKDVLEPKWTPSIAKINETNWKNYCREKVRKGQTCDYVEARPFEINWELSGHKTEKANLFETYVKTLASNPDTEKRFKELRDKRPKKPASPKDRTVHLWTLQDINSFSEYLSSTLHRQTVNLLKVFDSNSEALPMPKTYPYFLALLNWNIHHYGKELKLGSTRERKPVSDAHLAALLNDLVQVFGINLKNFAGWESVLIRNRPQPSDLAAMAKGVRDTYIGQGQHFLKTTMPAATTVNPSGGTNFTYKPFPMVDTDERVNFYASKLTDQEWLEKTRNPKDLELYRVFEGDPTNQPLYHRWVAVQLQRISERDIREGLPTERNEVSQRNKNDRDYNFGDGKGAIPKERVQAIQRKAQGLGIAFQNPKAAESEINELLAIRDPLARLTSAASELYTKLPFGKHTRILDGRNNDAVETAVDAVGWRWNRFILELQDMMSAYAKEFKDPNLKKLAQIDDLALSHDRAEAIGRVIRQAELIAHKAAGFEGNTKEALDKKEKELKASGKFNEVEFNKIRESVNRREKLLRAIEETYSEAAMKAVVLQGLKDRVRDNLDKELTTLCQMPSLAGIETKKDIDARQDDIKKLAQFNNTINFLFLRSDWISKDKQEVARDTYREFARIEAQQTTYRDFMDGLTTYVQWGTLLAFTGLFLGRGNPATSEWAAGATRIIPWGQLIFQLTLMSGFIWLEGDQVYQDTIGRPEEVRKLKQMQDTQTLVNGTSVSIIDGEKIDFIENTRQEVEHDKRSPFRWAWRAIAIPISINIGLIGLKLAGRVFRGGAAWAMRMPMWLNNARFRPAVKVLDLPKGSEGAYERVTKHIADAVGANEEVVDSAKRILKLTPSKDGVFKIPKQEAKYLADDAQIMMEQIAAKASLSANPYDIRPITTPQNQYGRLDPRRWFKWKAYLDESRADAIDKIKFLGMLREKLTTSDPELLEKELLELMRLMAAQYAPVVRHTPFLMQIFGLPYPTRRVRTLQQMYRLAQAHIDILNHFEREVLYSLVFLARAEGDGEKAAQLWELFNAQTGKKLIKGPRQLEELFEEIFKEAKQTAKAHAKASKGSYKTSTDQLGDEMTMTREIFEAIVTDQLTLNISEELVSENANLFQSAKKVPMDRLKALKKQVATAKEKYSAITVDGYANFYLRKRGLALSLETKRFITDFQALAERQDRLLLRCIEFSRKSDRKLEEVLHKALRLTKVKDKELIYEPKFDPNPQSSVGSAMLEGPEEELMQEGAHLVEDLERFGWIPNMEYLNAMVRQDYRAMANQLTSLYKARPDFEYLPDKVVGGPAKPQQVGTDLSTRLPKGLDQKVQSQLIEFASKQVSETVKDEASQRIIRTLLREPAPGEGLQRQAGRNFHRELKPGQEELVRLAADLKRDIEIAATFADDRAGLALGKELIKHRLQMFTEGKRGAMSIAEARELLGLWMEYNTEWPTPERIQAVAASLKSISSNPLKNARIDEAANLLLKCHPGNTESLSLEVLAARANIRLDALLEMNSQAAEHYLQVLLQNSTGATREAAETLNYLLFGFSDTLLDARIALGFRFNRAMIGFTHADLIVEKNALEARARALEGNLGKIGNLKLREAALANVAKAVRILSSPEGSFPLSSVPYSKTKSYGEPVFILRDSQFFKENRKHIKLSDERIDEILKDVDGSSLDAIEQNWARALGQLDLPADSQEEWRLLRLLHSSRILHMLQVNGHFGFFQINQGKLAYVKDLFLNRYVLQDRVEFKLSLWGYRSFVGGFSELAPQLHEYKAGLGDFTFDDWNILLHSPSERLAKLDEAITILGWEVDAAGGTLQINGKKLTKAYVEQLRAAHEALSIHAHASGEIDKDLALEGLGQIETTLAKYVLDSEALPIEFLRTLASEGFGDIVTQSIGSTLGAQKWRKIGQTNDPGTLFHYLFGPSKVLNKPLGFELGETQRTRLLEELNAWKARAVEKGETEVATSVGQAITRLEKIQPVSDEDIVRVWRSKMEIRLKQEEFERRRRFGMPNPRLRLDD